MFYDVYEMRSHMGAKDTKAKEFLSDNRRFADLFNYYLYDGEKVIKAEDLYERDTTKVISVFGADRKELLKQKWRDLLKSAIVKTTEYGIFILLGVENQSEVHYAMPVRNMIYDGMEYSSQVNEAARQHKKDKDYADKAEFLSGFKREDKLTPVITLTVYWGAEEWDAPRSLHDMIDEKYHTIMRYVDNYHLNLVIPNEIENFDKFQTSLGPRCPQRRPVRWSHNSGSHHCTRHSGAYLRHHRRSTYPPHPQTASSAGRPGTHSRRYWCRWYAGFSGH